MKKLRLLAVLVFGALFPALMLYHSYTSINTLGESAYYETSSSELIDDFAKVKESIDKPNDYALYSLMHVELGNQNTMLNKLMMKSMIIYIGFSVISVGIMLIVLGIRYEGADGLEGTFEGAGVKVDFKTSSSGVVVFCAGAVMSTLGGVLNSQYTASTIPNFEASRSPNSDEGRSYRSALHYFKECNKRQEKIKEACFYSAFRKTNKGKLN